MVTKCVCYDKPFSEMKVLAEKFNIKTVDGLQAHIPFGLNCKLCVSYVELMLSSGETEFGVLPPLRGGQEGS
jgi:hypothetical protein